MEFRCGDFLQQELAIVTGAVDAMVVDMQCIMENIANVAQCFHTKLITTHPMAKIAQVTRSISNSTNIRVGRCQADRKDGDRQFRKREKEVIIPDDKHDLIAGFS